MVFVFMEGMVWVWNDFLVGFWIGIIFEMCVCIFDFFSVVGYNYGVFKYEGNEKLRLFL